MNKVAVEVDQNLVAILHKMGKPVDQTVQELIVLQLYHQQQVSSGKAAELLGMGRFDFVEYASDLGIPFFRMTEEEWGKELKAIERLSTGTARKALSVQDDVPSTGDL